MRHKARNAIISLVVALLAALVSLFADDLGITDRDLIDVCKQYLREAHPL